MQILIFDMDGVLLEPNGYHLALQETVRLISLSLGFEAFTLLPEHIARFESIGISSEWHSSAFCMALMVIEARKQGFRFDPGSELDFPDFAPRPLQLQMESALSLIERQPIERPAIKRAVKAIYGIARNEGVDPDVVISIIHNSESVEHSLTLNVFQELVLGSTIYEQTYGKEPQLKRESYLKRYDRSLLGRETRKALLSWLEDPLHSAAIMTNRPSNTLFRIHGTPESELGAALVGLDHLPVIGFGEMSWLAEIKSEEVGTLLKPAAYHGLSAILAASGLPIEESLLGSYNAISDETDLDFSKLDNGSVFVFEDTQAGILAVESAAEALHSRGIKIQVEKIGLSLNPIKQKALDEVGAKVWDSIDDALISAISINDL